MKKLLFTIFFLASILYSNKAKSLEVSILTCAAGDEVYSVFGHTGIRFYDNDSNIDVVYNFGLFDFETPNFALKFISGRLLYSLGIQSMDDFMFEYIYYDREVVEQKMKLDDRTKKIIIERLNFLYLPENRDYIYSFLKKNCTSEIRDLLIYSGVKFRQEKLKTTHRQLINSHLKDHLWLKFGTDLLLGMTLDKKTDVFQSMFLPVILMQELRTAELNGRQLLENETFIYKTKNIKTKTFFRYLTPLLVFSVLLLVLAFKFPKSIMLIFSIILGFTGILLILIWVFSGHPEVKLNFNIFWANPLLLLYIPFIIKNQSTKRLSIILNSFLVFSLLIWIFRIQVFNISILPLIGILIILNLKMYNSSFNIGAKLKSLKK